MDNRAHKYRLLDFAGAAFFIPVLFYIDWSQVTTFDFSVFLITSFGIGVVLSSLFAGRILWVSRLSCGLVVASGAFLIMDGDLLFRLDSVPFCFFYLGAACGIVLYRDACLKRESEITA